MQKLAIIVASLALALSVVALVRQPKGNAPPAPLSVTVADGEALAALRAQLVAQQLELRRLRDVLERTPSGARVAAPVIPPPRNVDEPSPEAAPPIRKVVKWRAPTSVSVTQAAGGWPEVKTLDASAAGQPIEIEAVYEDGSHEKMMIVAPPKS